MADLLKWDPSLLETQGISDSLLGIVQGVASVGAPILGAREG